MTKEFSSIMELKSIRDQKSRLSEREQELSSPVLTDLSLIPEIYGWFKDILAGMDCPPNPESVTQRKKFLFIVLFLFAPSVQSWPAEWEDAYPVRPAAPLLRRR